MSATNFLSVDPPVEGVALSYAEEFDAHCPVCNFKDEEPA